MGGRTITFESTRAKPAIVDHEFMTVARGRVISDADAVPYESRGRGDGQTATATATPRGDASRNLVAVPASLPRRVPGRCLPRHAALSTVGHRLRGLLSEYIC